MRCIFFVKNHTGYSGDREEDCTGLTVDEETAALIQTNIAWAEMRGGSRERRNG